HQTLYVTNSSARLHGIVALRVSGCMLVEAWRRDLGRDMSPASSPTVAGNVVYYGTGHDHEVVALDARDGRALWHSRAIRRAVFAAPTVIAGRVFVGSWDQHLYALAPVRRS